MEAARLLNLWNNVYLLALAATLVATIFVLRYSRQVSGQADERIAAANERASVAEQNAATAVEGQRRVELELEQARVRQKELDLATESLRAKNLELERQLGLNQQAVVALDRRTAPRTLSPGARASVVQSLSQYRGTEVVMHIGNDPESTRFGTLLAEVLSDAGWTGEGGAALFTGQVPSGLILHAEGVGVSAANALAEALRKHGIGATFTGRGNDVTAGRKVSIGVGPLPVR